MTIRFPGSEPLGQQINHVLDELAKGARPRDIERMHVDVKEERGRRDERGHVQPGSRENERAAEHLAEEMACFANTPGGGAIILGLADDGTRIGTELDADWLRHRIYQLSNRLLTITAYPVELDSVRMLVLVAPEALEPIRYHGRIKHRLDDNCVEIDATTWIAHASRRARIDWSAELSGHSLRDVSAIAVEHARRYLRTAAEKGDTSAGDLAAAPIPDLLRRLGVMNNEERLTQAGSLLFVGTPDVGIEYVRRETAGGDSRHRIRNTRPLTEQLAEVDAAIEATNPLVHVPDGLAHAQARTIPTRPIREALVNGIIHRDWYSPQPTVVEHIGNRMSITSPGGFIGGVDATNIITHPAVPRYRSLADAAARLRLAEKEGIGVDRMVLDMLSQGHDAPQIEEIPGPYVRVVLIGGPPDAQVLAFLASLTPPSAVEDVDVLPLLRHLMRAGWVDVASAKDLLQRNATETADAIERLTAVRVKDAPVIVPIRGVPAGAPPAHRLSDTARKQLGAKNTAIAQAANRSEMIVAWARARGRVSSTEVADMTGLTASYVSQLLAELEENGALTPNRANRKGRGFHYLPASEETAGSP